MTDFRNSNLQPSEGSLILGHTDCSPVIFMAVSACLWAWSIAIAERLQQDLCATKVAL